MNGTMGNVGLHTDYLLVDKHACQWIFRVFNEDWADVLVQVFPQDPSNTPVVWMHQVRYTHSFLAQLPPHAREAEMAKAHLFEKKYREVTEFKYHDPSTGWTEVGIRIRFNRDNTMRLEKGDARRLWERIRQDFPNR